MTGMRRMSASKRRSLIGAPGGSFRFPIYCSISEPDRIKGDWYQKSRQNFALFDHPKNLGEGGQNVLREFLNSTYDQAFNILMPCRRCACLTRVCLMV